MAKAKAHATTRRSKVSADQDSRGKTARQDPPGTPLNQNLPAAPARPGGKLGLIVDHLATSDGVMVDELSRATGWQKHSVLGALSRLRGRGFILRLEAKDGLRLYRLERAEG